jgi:hypothetical protein
MKWVRVVAWVGVLAACLGPAGEKARRAEAAVLLQYGTNVAKVSAVELNYSPDQPLLQVAVTTDGHFVKRAEYRRDAAIQAIVELLRYKQRGRLFIVYDENKILSFFVQE